MDQPRFKNQDQSPTPVLINITEFARLLRISIRTFQRYRSAGLIPEAIMVGGRPLWLLEEVLCWIKASCPAPNAKSH